MFHYLGGKLTFKTKNCDGVSYGKMVGDTEFFITVRVRNVFGRNRAADSGLSSSFGMGF